MSKMSVYSYDNTFAQILPLILGVYGAKAIMEPLRVITDIESIQQIKFVFSIIKDNVSSIIELFNKQESIKQQIISAFKDKFDINIIAEKYSVELEDLELVLKEASSIPYHFYYRSYYTSEHLEVTDLPLLVIILTIKYIDESKKMPGKDDLYNVAKLHFNKK